MALLLSSAACRSAATSTAPLESVSVVVGPYVGDVGPDRFRILWETSDPVPTHLSWGAERDCPTAIETAEPVTRHDVLVSGLRPDTVYWYRLEMDGGGRESIPVRTQPDTPRRIRVAVVGDTHGTGGVHARIVGEILRENPDLLVHTGDLSLRPGKREGNVEREFFRVEGPLLRSVPIYPVLGNHDGNGSRFVELFVRPHGVGEATYYLVRWGTLALVALDTNESVEAGSTQGLWLARTLESLAGDAGVVFRVVAMHWGPFESGSGHGSNLESREALVPLFERYGVDLVFSGHDHVYERGTVRGVRYVMTGGGGGGRRKPHEVLGDSWTEASSSAPHHCLVEIDGRELRFTAREAGSGRILDEFHVVKDPALRGKR
ncbi:MAG: metallophosphoesterase [Holophagales bacterium]|nr:metallophosphoesterase [Holophagales bacterium]